MKLVDGDGFDALNLSAVAEDLGVGPSALYTHVDGLSGLRYLVAVQSTTNLANVIRNAAVGVAGDGALEAIGTAYRQFAHTNAGQFASTFLPPTVGQRRPRQRQPITPRRVRARLPSDGTHPRPIAPRGAQHPQRHPRLLRPRTRIGHDTRPRRRVPPPPRNAPTRPTSRPTNETRPLKPRGPTALSYRTPISRTGGRVMSNTCWSGSTPNAEPCMSTFAQIGHSPVVAQPPGPDNR